MSKSHVLIVDDDIMIQKMVSFLTSQGLNLRTSQVASGKEMSKVLKNDKVDLLVLDLTLPDEDGLVLARQVRSRSNIPILVLTGDETKETLIAALELGVEDFVRKPFDPYELQLRIRNLVGRVGRQTETRRKRNLRKHGFGEYVLNLEERSLKKGPDDEVHLTYNEFNILNALAQANGRPVSRGTLLDVIAKGADAPTERAIDVYIRQLRMKIESTPKQPEHLLTSRGYGYRLIIDG